MATQQSTEFIPYDAWILDSHHIIADVNSLNQVTYFEGFETITLGNGTGLPIANIGSTILKTKSSERLLKNVLHVPNISRSLLYVQQLCANNLAGSFVMKMYSLCMTRRQRGFRIKEIINQDNCFKFVCSKIQRVCNLQYKVHQVILDSW